MFQQFTGATCLISTRFSYQHSPAISGSDDYPPSTSPLQVVKRQEARLWRYPNEQIMAAEKKGRRQAAIFTGA